MSDNMQHQSAGGLKEVAKLISTVKKAAFVAHYNPDGDAYGAMLGLALAMQERGKEIFCADETPLQARFRSFPQVEKVLTQLPDPRGLDALFVLDCGSFGRVGDSLLAQAKRFPVIANIDHHLSNDSFGTINFVVPSASSTCELVYDILEYLDWTPSQQVANSLLAGIMWDTGGFSYSSTSARTFAVASRLVSCGAVPHEISRELFESNPIPAVKIQAEALMHMKLHFSGKVAEVVVMQDLYKKYNGGPDDTEGLVEKVRATAGVEIGVMLRQEGELWKVSLRAKDPSLNLSDVAATFGGGGHMSAAAFRSRLPLAELRSALLTILGKLIGCAS